LIVRGVVIVAAHRSLLRKAGGRECPAVLLVQGDAACELYRYASAEKLSARKKLCELKKLIG
jgi:hypothetical protein